MKKLFGKNAPLERLTAFRRSGRFPHALMFCGEKGVGRGVLADYAAALLLCERGGEAPCGECRACRRIEAHIHPDVIYPLSASENGKYTAEGLRALIADSCKSPNDGALRVIVFENTDAMSAVCQNALLKFIEEPLPFNRCLFTAENKSAVLETVLSRVTCVNVGEADRAECLAALAENGINSEKAEELYGLFGGNIGKCLDGVNDENAAALFGAAAKIAEAVCGAKEYDCAAELASLKTREEVGQVLSLLSACFAGAAEISAGSGKKARGALSAQSEKIAKKLGIKTIYGLYEAICGLSASLESNPNVSLLTAHCCARLFSVLEENF